MIKDLAWSHSTTLKLFHIYAAYRTCELFYHSQAWDRLFYSIVSCIQFQHRIIVHPVPASYRVSSYSIALLCIQFQQRIEIQFPNRINVTVHVLPSWCDYRAEAWITYLPGLNYLAESSTYLSGFPAWMTERTRESMWMNYFNLTWWDYTSDLIFHWINTERTQNVFQLGLTILN